MKKDTKKIVCINLHHTLIVYYNLYFKKKKYMIESKKISSVRKLCLVCKNNSNGI